MIRAVLFDLDGTLYDRDAVICELASEQHHTFGEHFHGVGADRFVTMLVGLDDHGYASKPQLYAQLAREYGLRNDLAARMEGHFWDAYDRLCCPSQETLRVLSTLRRAGLKLGVVTNGSTARQTAKLDALGLAPFFDAILISEAEGIKKPDATIFWRALQRCGVTAAETVFVGDHPDVDVAGARSAGLTPVWKRVPYWNMALEGVLTIDGLDELLPVCLPRESG